MRGVNTRDQIAAMNEREVEQVNFAVAVQSQEASRVANIPHSSGWASICLHNRRCESTGRWGFFRD